MAKRKADRSRLSLLSVNPAARVIEARIVVAGFDAMHCIIGVRRFEHWFQISVIARFPDFLIDPMIYLVKVPLVFETLNMIQILIFREH